MDIINSLTVSQSYNDRNIVLRLKTPSILKFGFVLFLDEYTDEEDNYTITPTYFFFWLGVVPVTLNWSLCLSLFVFQLLEDCNLFSL